MEVIMTKQEVRERIEVTRKLVKVNAKTVAMHVRPDKTNAHRGKIRTKYKNITHLQGLEVALDCLGVLICSVAEISLLQA